MPKDNKKLKDKRYKRIQVQLQNLFEKTEDKKAHLSTAIAILHHKFEHFFWTGYYHLIDDELTVGSYQGSVACLVLEKKVGVCWKAITDKKTIIIKNINEFEGHIACDSRSKSEICIPIFDDTGKVWAVFDVDSKEYDSFDEIDAENLEQIIKMI